MPFLGHSFSDRFVDTGVVCGVFKAHHSQIAPKHVSTQHETYVQHSCKTAQLSIYKCHGQQARDGIRVFKHSSEICTCQNNATRTRTKPAMTVVYIPTKRPV